MQEKLSFNDSVSNLLTILVLVFFICWPKYFGFNFGSVKISPYTIACILSLIFFIISGDAINLLQFFLTRNLAVVKMIPAIWAVEFIAALISTANGGDQARYDILLRNSIGFHFLFIVGFSIAIKNNGEWRFLNILRYSMGIVCFIAICEYAYEVRLFDFLKIESNSSDSVMLSMMEEKSRDGFFRAQSTFDHPIILAIASSVLMAIQLVLLGNQRMLGNFVLLAISIVSGYSSGSRTFYIGVVVCLAVIFAYKIKKNIHNQLYVSTFLLFCCVVVFFSGVFYDDLIGVLSGRTDLEASSSEMRKDMWYLGGNYIDQRPFFGWGAGSDLKYAGIEQGDIYTIDDFYLSCLINFGYFGLISHVIYMLVAIVVAIDVCKIEKQRFESIGIVALCVICGVSITQFGNSIHYPFGFVNIFCGVLCGIFYKNRMNTT